MGEPMNDTRRGDVKTLGSAFVRTPWGAAVLVVALILGGSMSSAGGVPSAVQMPFIDSSHVVWLESLGAELVAGDMRAVGKLGERFYAYLRPSELMHEAVIAAGPSADRAELLQLALCETPLRVDIRESGDDPVVVFSEGLPESLDSRCLARALEIVPFLFPGGRESVQAARPYSGRESICFDPWIAGVEPIEYESASWNALAGGWPDSLAMVNVTRFVLWGRGRHHGYTDIWAKREGNWVKVVELWGMESGP